MIPSRYDTAVTAALCSLVLIPLIAMGFVWRFDIELWRFL